MPISPRKKAVDMLMNVEKNFAYINIEMNKLRASCDFSPVDVRFIGEIVNGVTKRKITLDYIISLHSNIKLKKIAPFVLAVLRSGIYQIIYMDKVPDSAAVNESVKLVKKSSVSRSAGFVNAILRAVSVDDLKGLDVSTPSGLSIAYSFPEWMIKRWMKRYDTDFVVGLLNAMNRKPPLCVRRNVSVSSEELLAKLKKDSISASSFSLPMFPEFDYCLKLDNVNSLTSTQAFRDGCFYVQDPAAALAAYLLEPIVGDVVIDMCAAPGGKSLFAAELMGNVGRIIAFDIYEHKLSLIADNCTKHKISIVEPKLQDSACYNDSYRSCADKIICDVPCSGLGIMRKKPDIRFSRTEEDISILADLSSKILDNAAKYLKVGGTLIFSTCTIEPEENEQAVGRFLDSHKEFLLYPFADGKISYKTFYPNTDDTDGFFVCRLKKNGETQ